MKPSTVLITGASRGIGRAAAYAFASKGYHLILVCRNSGEILQLLCDELRNSYHIECNMFQGDVGDEVFVSSLFSQIDSLDVLVNNAGISYFGLLQDMTLQSWNQVFSTNLTAAFLFSKYAIPLMLKSGHGRIINISSAWGTTGASLEVAYSASKSGLNGLTRALAKELAPSNIQVNAIACGMIDTDMNHNLTTEEIDTIKENIPTGRLGTSEEVAFLIMQLACAGNYLTGQIIGFDGGWI